MADLVLTREQARELDRRALEEHGVPALLLMENAGRACAEEAERLLGPGTAEPVAVLCGPGNNGGDGFVVARTLVNRGRAARVSFLGPRAKLDELGGAFAAELALYRALGHEVRVLETPAEAAALAPELARAPLVVDALFGTGLARAIAEPWRRAIEAVNACGRPVLAVDLPSGLDADSGAVLGAAVRATVTVTFVAPKRGCLVGRGPELCGRLVVAEIGIPRPLLDEARR